MFRASLNEQRCDETVDPVKRATFVSAFSGCGGFDVGFSGAGYRCLGAYDIDPLALAVHRQNLEAPTVECDLTAGRSGGVVLPTADVLLAGSPCQGFSTMGRRRLDDPRNELLLAAGTLALTMHPRVFVVENVAAVTSGAHRRFWDGLVGMLRGAGYRTLELVVQAEAFGVPQVRKRVLLIAWRIDREIRPLAVKGQKQVLRDALANIKAAPNHDPKRLPLGSIGARIAAHIQPGQKLSNVRSSARAVHTWDVPEVFGRCSSRQKQILEVFLRERRRNRLRDHGDADPVTLTTVRKALDVSVDRDIEALMNKGYVRKVGRRYDLTHTFNGKYRRLRWDQPAPTVDTKFGDSRLFLHPSQCRGFTVREAARIQGFPDEFVFHGGIRDQYRMIGNAVPPPVATALATWIRDAILVSR